MTTFLGNSSLGEGVELSQEKLISSVEDGQAAFVALNQLQSEIKNSQMQMVGNMEELRKSRSSEAKEKHPKKLPKCLLVCFTIALCECIKLFRK